MNKNYLGAFIILLLTIAVIAWAYAANPVTPAPAGFDNLTNGHISQADYDHNRDIFNEAEGIDDGLGPVYNSDSCGQCHQNVVPGGQSQVTELRSGSTTRHGPQAAGNNKGLFAQSAGGTLIESRAIDASIVEYVGLDDNVRTFRITTNTLGDGFVEAVLDQTILSIKEAQSNDIKGMALTVPVLEAGSAMRVGRFGWKAQHASLFSFAADAYLNEMGITSPLFPRENNSNGRSVAAFDRVADPENNGTDVAAFTDFMRSTKVPPRGPSTSLTAAGEAAFTYVGCASCHTPSIQTAPVGTQLAGLTVDAALGDKIIHPYSDFLLHNVGTGDGIPVNSDHPETANMIKTPPLWGLRTRNRLMHDGLAFTFMEAIEQHDGQAKKVINNFRNLDDPTKAALLDFLNTL